MKKISEEVVYKGEWLSMVESVYETKQGDQICWESVRRHREAFGVVVVAQLMPSRRLILIKQYRQALGAHVLGFPAGLSLQGQHAKDALKELKEETGYTGVIVAESPVLKSNSGVMNDSGRVVYVHVDEHDPINQSPQQELEPSEDIEVVILSYQEAQPFLMKEYEMGTAIGANLWYMFCLMPLLGVDTSNGAE